jgi:hypothetical protein
LEVVRPFEVVSPLEVVSPFDVVKPFEVVRPLEVVRPFDVVRPLDVVRPFEVVRPLDTVCPFEVVRPLEVVSPFDNATFAALFAIWMLAVTLEASGAALRELRLPINDFFWIAISMFSSISFCLLPGSLQFACTLTYCDSMAKLKNPRNDPKSAEIVLWTPVFGGKARADESPWVEI